MAYQCMQFLLSFVDFLILKMVINLQCEYLNKSHVTLKSVRISAKSSSVATDGHLEWCREEQPESVNWVSVSVLVSTVSFIIVMAVVSILRV